MNTRESPSNGAQLAVVVLALLGLIGGWLIVLEGGFHHMNSRYSLESSFVPGAPAAVVAALFFLFAAIGTAALIQLRRGSVLAYLIGCGAVLGTPVLFLLLR